MGEVIAGPARDLDGLEHQFASWRRRHPDQAAKIDSGDYFVVTFQWLVRPRIPFWGLRQQDRYTMHLVRHPAPPEPVRRLPG